MPFGLRPAVSGRSRRAGHKFIRSYCPPRRRGLCDDRLLFFLLKNEKNGGGGGILSRFPIAKNKKMCHVPRGLYLFRKK
jgi:hypothetical protein